MKAVLERSVFHRVQRGGQVNVGVLQRVSERALRLAVVVEHDLLHLVHPRHTART